MTPEQIQTAVTMKAQGESLRAIGAAVGVSHPAVYQQLQKDEIQHLIKQAQTDLIKNSLQTAIENQSAKIKAGQTITNRIINQEKLSDGSVKLLELAHASEQSLMQAVGIAPSHTQSIQFNQLILNQQSSLSPAIESMLTKHLLGDVVANPALELDSQVVDMVEDDSKT